MARADRLERLDARREGLEADYRVALIAALRVTAAGTWGLFAHHRDRAAQAKAAPVIARLQDMADEINDLRAQLGLDPFALHVAFLDARGPVSPDAVGEPKQARAWLDRLDAEDATG